MRNVLHWIVPIFCWLLFLCGLGQVFGFFHIFGMEYCVFIALAVWMSYKLLSQEEVPPRQRWRDVAVMLFVFLLVTLALIYGD